MSNFIMNTTVRNGPRFRVTPFDTVNGEFFDILRNKYAWATKYTNSQLKKIIHTYNRLLCDAVIKERDGVLLPNSIGLLFIGRCNPPKYRSYLEYQTGILGDRTFTTNNMSSSGYLAKVFYSQSYQQPPENMAAYTFKADRNFKMEVSKNFVKNWQNYIFVPSNIKVGSIVEKSETAAKKYTKEVLTPYNELDL